MGPLQIVHDFQFVALNLKDNYETPFLEMTEKEKRAHITMRLERFAERGYSGVVVTVDNKNYLEDEDALKRLKYAVDEAKRLGLKVWIYDEQYYPSGGAGDIVLRNHPELDTQALCMFTKDVHSPSHPVRIMSPYGHSELKYAYAVPLGDKPSGETQIDISSYRDPAGNLCWSCPSGDFRIYCFFVRVQYEYTYLMYANRAPRHYPSIINKDAIKRFLDVTYDKYGEYLSEHFGSTVEAIFTDEPAIPYYRPLAPNYDPENAQSIFASYSTVEPADLNIPSAPYISWSDDMSETFERMHGYELPPMLPALFEGDFDETAELKRDFYNTFESLFDAAFTKQYADRLKKLNIKLSGHYIGEEDFKNYPVLYGDILHGLGQMDIVGCDFLNSERESLRCATPLKVASSAAHLYGKERVMIEASNMTDKDQNITLQKMLGAVSVMFALGINTITSYYGENIFDDESYKTWTKYIKNLDESVGSGKHCPEALVYMGYDQIAAYTSALNSPIKDPRPKLTDDSLTDLTKELLSRQIDFDFINADCLNECTVSQGKLVTKSGERASMLILPEIDFVDKPMADMIEKALRGGVSVYAYGEKHTIRNLCDDSDIKFISDGYPGAKDVIITPQNREILYLHKVLDGEDRYLIVNTGITAASFNVELHPLHGNKMYRRDILTGEETEFNGELTLGGDESTVIICRQIYK